DPEEPEWPVGSLGGDHDAADREVEDPRRGLPEGVDGELVPARHDEPIPAQEQRVTCDDDRERDPRQPVGEDEQDDRSVDHQPVAAGGRGGRGTARPGARPRQRRASQPSSWSATPATPKTIAAAQLPPPSAWTRRTTKTGTSTSRKIVSAFGSCWSGAGTARAD